MDMSYLLVFLAKPPPSLGTELTLQGVSNSWDQFGTHPWEENVLWNNFFFFFLLNSKDKKLKEKKCQRAAQYSGCIIPWVLIPGEGNV